MSETSSNPFKAHNCCVIIPTYNNEKTLQRIVDGVLQFCPDVIVVDDGSTDSTKSILTLFQGQIDLVQHEVNRGKGRAIRNGFMRAIELGYSYAITIDSDGQHFPDDLPKLLEASVNHPEALIMGSRNMEQEGVPGKSSFGNKFSNFWFYVETGIKMPDTQTGYRLYPLNQIKKRRYFTNKFEFEIEVIVKMAWMEVPFIAVPVNVSYDPEERVSHFRPFKDFTRISILNTYLVTLTLLWHLHVRIFRKLVRKGLWTAFKEEWRNGNESNLKKATAIGFGIFMGIFPVWGFQMLIAGVLAKLFRLNVIITLLASNISIPPMIPLLLFASYWTGGLLLHDSIALSWNSGLSLEDIYLNVKQYFVGSIVFASFAGILSFLISLLVLNLFRKNKNYTSQKTL